MCPPRPSRRLAPAAGRWPAASSGEEAPRAVGVPGAVTRSREIGLAVAARSVEEEADAGSSSLLQGQSLLRQESTVEEGEARPRPLPTVNHLYNTLGGKHRRLSRLWSHSWTDAA
jgi:hypothetical protein